MFLQRGKLGKVYKGPLCVISYNSMWTCSYRNKSFQLKQVIEIEMEVGNQAGFYNLASPTLPDSSLFPH